MQRGLKHFLEINKRWVGKSGTYIEVRILIFKENSPLFAIRIISAWKKQFRCWFILTNLRNTEQESLVLEIGNMGFQKLISGGRAVIRDLRVCTGSPQ